MMNYLAKVVAQNLKNQNVVISKNIDILSNSLNDNIRALQLWFVNELNESLSNILVDIDDKIEKVANGIKTNTATIESIQSIKPKQEVMISDSESIDSIVNGLKKTMQDIEAIINQKNGGK